MIKIRSFFGEWREVTKEEAKEYIQSYLKRMPAVGDNEKRRGIAGRYLKGITVDELLEG